MGLRSKVQGPNGKAEFLDPTSTTSGMVYYKTSTTHSQAID
jgi:hypothetical protein